MEGHLQEHFDHDDEYAREDGRTAENEEIASADITGKRDDRGHDERRPENDGERKGKEPLTAREFADEKEIEGSRRKIAGDENDGIRMGKPRRQEDHDVGKRNTADGVKRPIQLVEDREFADEELDGDHGVEHGDEEKHTALIDTGMRAAIGGIIGRDVLLHKLGMIYLRFAKGTGLFGIGKLDTAFDTIHDELLSFA